jgi:hypothetical protein
VEAVAWSVIGLGVGVTFLAIQIEAR